ncbi:MAG: ATP-binding protein [Microcoleus sp.]
MLTSIDELAAGGRGLQLMWQIADDLSYTRTADDRNCLFVSKNYEAASSLGLQNRKQPSDFNELMKLLNRWDWLDDVEQQEELDEIPVAKISLEANTDLQSLSEVLKWFDGLQYLSIPDEIWLECQLALAEGFTNAVRHAHKYLPSETPIQLEVKVFNGCLEIRIWDCGKPFDLMAKLNEITDVDRQQCAVSEDLNTAIFVQNKLQNIFSDPCLVIAG